MDVPELMKKLNKKAPSQESEAKKEDETVGNLPLWSKPLHFRYHNVIISFGEPLRGKPEKCEYD